MNTTPIVEGYLHGEVLTEDHACFGRHCAVCEYDTDRATTSERER